MANTNLQKIGGVSAVLEAIIYITAFIVYGGVLEFPNSDASPAEKYNFLSENYSILSLLNFTSYVLFGIFLAVMVLAIYQRQTTYAPNVSRLSSIFGYLWVGLVIASGMIANIGLDKVVQIGADAPEKALQIWSSIGIVTEGLGGGNEIVGGLWVLLLSLATWRHNVFPKALTWLGLVVGLVGVLTVFPLELFKELFGLSQIAWFLWIGWFMIRNPEVPKTT